MHYDEKALKVLMEEIKSKEGGPGLKGYGQIYGKAKGVPLSTDVSKLALKDVIRFQDKMKKGGSASTAVGGYQFIKSTFITTIMEMKLDVNKVWTPELQDRMAMHLMNKRGLQNYLKGTLSAEGFANNLAKEWASLPVVTPIIGSKKKLLQPGVSYYTGDKLNKSHHDYRKILKLVKAVKPQSNPAAAVPA